LKLEVVSANRQHFAILADEFGVGVVTLVDVLDAIGGDVRSQGQHSHGDIRPGDDGTWAR
jgi:CBS domain containing-hemolysin-like protein